MSSPTQMQMLPCPECDGECLLPVAKLVAGALLACPHCGAELIVSHDRDTPDGPPIWRLEIPDLVEERPAGGIP